MVLARELPSVDRVRGVLLVKLRNIAGCYRVGSVFVSTRAAYLENRELLWGTTPSIRLQRENPPRTREFTGPKGASDDSILSNIEKEINTLKTGGSSGEPFQAEGGDQIGSIADRLRQSKKRDNIIKPSGGKRYANPDAEKHARVAEDLRNQEPRDFRQEFGKQEGQYFTARFGRAIQARVRRLDGSGRKTRGGVRVLARWEAPAELKNVYGLNGMATPAILELAHSPESAEVFRNAILAARRSNPFAASVYVYEAADYQNMSLFLTDDETTGLAVKPNGDIVSVFNTAGGPHKGVSTCY